ncbi:MAG: hypothetical protein DCC58_15250 [Chloroflexi bacterium]|nr:MAG: hypothetical protein DCC58_15250 [Chloroflexota bacterium]
MGRSLRADIRQVWGTPAGQGFILLSIMMATFGMAMSAQENITTNFFEEVLGFSGPQFGYITAIREVPGFLLIFLAAIFYRLTLPHLTALAMVLLAIGFAGFGLATSFWSVAPWVILHSLGYHTVLQTQYALGMTLTTEARSGSILGRLNAISNGASVVGMVVILVVFHYDLLDFGPSFVVFGSLAILGAAAVYFFPNLRDGIVQQRVARRDPIVVRRSYRYYYYLTLLDGARQQIFFSFGLWVLVHEYGLTVAGVSALLIVIRLLATISSPWIGRMVDLHGERAMLSAVNVGYIIALGGYALVHNVAVAAACYIVYSIIFPLSSIGSATYLRKVAVDEEIAPSLAMGLSLQHAAAIVVPVATGVILNYVGFQVPFLIACVFAVFTIFVTRRLDPATQKSAARLKQDAEREAADRLPAAT